MKKRNNIITKSISALVVAVLAILAFVRGPIMIWLMAAAFVLWGGVVIFTTVSAHVERQKYAPRQAQTKRAGGEAVDFEVPELSENSNEVMMRHVNYRISTELSSRYGNCTWEWDCTCPEQLVVEGGEARILVYNVDGFNGAYVHFKPDGRIAFTMLRMVSLAKEGSEERVPTSKPVDIKVWFDVSARAVLESLVANLSSQNHSRLVIKDDGDVVVMKGDQEVCEQHLENMPERVHWPAVVKALENLGLAAKNEEAGIAVTF